MNTKTFFNGEMETETISKNERIRKADRVMYVLMFFSPVMFFFGLRFLHYIFGREVQDTLKIEIIQSVMCAYAGCFGVWLLNRKLRKQSKGK